jgi:hypothetical protein
LKQNPPQTDISSAGQGILFLLENMIEKYKDKAIPLQAWTGPERSRKLRLPNFKIVGI